MTANIVGNVAVELLRLLDQVQRVAKHCRADGKFLAGVRQSGSRAFPLTLDFVQLRADLRLGECVVRG